MNGHEPKLVTGETENGVLVATIHVEAVHDSVEANALRDQLRALIESSRATRLIIDGRKISYIGSLGLLAFLSARRVLGEGPILICGLADRVREVFAVCRLIPNAPGVTAPFGLEATLEDAIARLTPSSV